MTAASGCSAELPGEAGIRIVAPAAMGGVDVPFEVRWEAGEQSAGGYAVFVDRAPIAPGRDLRSLASRERDNACLARPDCPDASWLRARRVYLSDEATAVVDAVAGDLGGGDVHRISVVALDADGRRPSDDGAFVEVVVDEDG